MKLEDLNIGDSVTIFSRWEADRIEKITLKTKTLLITSSLSKFNINAGNRVPNDNFFPYSTRIKPTK